ncbi:hypothetical protein K1T71_015081 [Dendrolimus kikuchii]|nr:hypothetical protein K1T71_015081 [Dendrolimus kikuchii]
MQNMLGDRRIPSDALLGIQETELPIVHKPVIDPLSDFVYEEDDAISLTDSDEEEFLNEYKNLLKLENDNLGTKNKETNLSTEKALSEKASSVGKIKKSVKAAAKNLKGPKKVQKVFNTYPYY